jgi:hypothetical protein
MPNLLGVVQLLVMNQIDATFFGLAKYWLSQQHALNTQAKGAKQVLKYLSTHVDT